MQVAVIRQFGGTFDPYAVMRRRRNELEYPEFPDEIVEPGEAATVISSARAIIDAAGELLGHLGIFT